MLSAGEASGDLHGASLFRELRRLLPGLHAIGMGGPAMRDAGVDLVFDSSGIGVIGLAEIARHYGEIRSALRQMIETARTRRPDLLICIDYKEFNFRLAKAAKAAGIKVLFYVSPQVWAWRPGRVKKYGRYIDHMAVIFPFEVPFYESHGIPVTYVGHPLAGKVHTNATPEATRRALGISTTTPLVGLLPGSRGNEIRRLLPVILAAAGRLAKEFPELRFLLFQARSVKDATIDDALAASGLPILRRPGRDYDALACCDAVITVSGTATLEVALLGVPMVIVYRLAPLSYWLGRLLVRIPWIGLPNILAGQGIVREFIQGDASPENISAEISRILRNPAVATAMRRDLGEVKARIGERDGSVELARLAARLLGPGSGSA